MIGRVKILLLLSILVTGNAIADTIDINLGALHLPSCYDPGDGSCISYNNKTPGIGFSLSLENNFKFVAGTYKNSFYYLSEYAGVGYDKKFYSDTNIMYGFGILTGLATGYSHTIQSNTFLTMMILPQLLLGSKDVWLSVGVLPSANTVKYTNIFTLQASILLN